MPDILSRRALLTASGLAIASLPVGANAKNSESGLGVVILIASNDPSAMGHSISYSANLARHFAESRPDTPISIEVVANSSGIDLFRADRSTLEEPLSAIRASFPNVAFSVCGSSKAIAEQREGKPVPILAGVTVVPYGIGRVADLQLAGWAYVHG